MVLTRDAQIPGVGAGPVVSRFEREGPLRDLVQHFERVYPEEGCGLLMEDMGTRRLHFRAIRNASATPRVSFEFDLCEWLAAAKSAASCAQRLVAVAHSHPDREATLSEEDRRSVAPGGCVLLPGVRLLVVSVKGGVAREARSFAIDPRW